MSIVKLYKQNPNFPERYISPKKLFKYLQKNFSNCIELIGMSSLGKPIYKFSIGDGDSNVLAWSQMHGNESNSTHALLDFLEIRNTYPTLFNDLFGKISLDFIFMLNPDGSENWTRRNAFEIDINRDFHKMSSKEIRLLKSIVENGNYDYALNLHEQRSIFTTDEKNPAVLSFLAPSENFDRDITETRKKCMAVISKVYEKLNDEIPNMIGRYTDEFYPTSVGDNFTRLKLPTILFEGGFYINDYQRVFPRKYYTVALFYALESISELNGSTDNYELYFNIPENRNSHFDIIYRNVRLNTDFECILDIAVQYVETYTNGNAEIEWVPIVKEVGDCSKKKGWKEIDCTNKQFKSERNYPKLDEKVDFEII